jgi:hypothetical protein
VSTARSPVLGEGKLRIALYESLGMSGLSAGVMPSWVIVTFCPYVFAYTSKSAEKVISFFMACLYYFWVYSRVYANIIACNTIYSKHCNYLLNDQANAFAAINFSV